MPLPIAHTLISTGIFAAYKGEITLREDKWYLLLFAVAGLLPDVDLITVPFSGFGAHRGVTHSILFALLSASYLFAIVKVWKRDLPLRLFPFLLAAAVLHPVCDFFTYDFLLERGGVMLLFPLTDEYYQSPVPLFMGIELRYLDTIFSARTVVALMYEAVVAGAFLYVVLHLKKGLSREEARD